MKTLKLVVCGALVASAQAWAGCLDTSRLVGVNTSGAEFNSHKLPGEINKNYIYPTTTELAFIKEQGATVIRLPIRWERIQRALNSPLDVKEVARVQQTLVNANAVGLCVVIDIHNYAEYSGQDMEGNAALQNSFVDLWLRMAREFTNPDTAIFDLMNEPSHIPIPEWAVLAKRALAELRSANSKNIVMVSGGRWSGVHDWFTPQLGLSNADAFANIKDPLNRVVLQAHQYVDSDYSGRGTDCRAPEKFDAMFQKISAWAIENKQRLFLGEFGTPQTSDCLLTLERLLLLTDGPAWLGWTYWATGRWWPVDYPYLLTTTNVGISPQWAKLKKYFRTPVSSQSPPSPPTLKR